MKYHAKKETIDTMTKYERLSIEKLRKINAEPFDLPTYPYHSLVDKRIVDNTEVGTVTVRGGLGSFNRGRMDAGTYRAVIARTVMFSFRSDQQNGRKHCDKQQKAWQKYSYAAF